MIKTAKIAIFDQNAGPCWLFYHNSFQTFFFQVDSRAESIDKKISRLDGELKKYKDQV